MINTPLKVNTSVAKENGFNPVFNREFEFNITTTFPELVFIKWNVNQHDHGYWILGQQMS
ncbi:hypothetical protein SLS62_006971 [Diatrype stigma]|uniref:C2 domain-containing protein n=1 Tax=Diatrype stigma TaxID=117547 RepID=A0AAN9UQ65_9PEZI